VFLLTHAVSLSTVFGADVRVAELRAPGLLIRWLVERNVLRDNLQRPPPMRGARLFSTPITSTAASLVHEPHGLRV
jgi:hypothetical protein